jgi:putative Mg2+ transporter-C (MgtC) family protein
MYFHFHTALQLLLSLFLGALIGVDREWKGKKAGLQTYSLVCLGSCVFTLVGLEFINYFASNPSLSFDPARIVQAVTIAIGFIGGGVIFKKSVDIEGLTTAAGIWIAAAVGITVGIKLYFLAVITTLMAIIVFTGFGLLEKKIFNRYKEKENREKL